MGLIGFESWQELGIFLFTMSTLALASTQHPYQMGTRGYFPGGKVARK
jgi:hypothetical protein